MSETSLRSIDRNHHLGAQVDYGEVWEDGGSLVIERGEGCYVIDEAGKRYLDAMAGLWCVNIGYGREAMAETAARQVRDLSFYHSFFKTVPAPTAKLAERIAGLLGSDLQHVFFANSGSEANDTLFRMARRYWAAVGKPEKVNFISLENSYHGSTVAGASLGGIAKMHEGGLPIAGCHHIPRPYLFAAAPEQRQNPDQYGRDMAQGLQREIDRLGADTIAAFIAEPVQGAGGVNIPPKSWWTEVERICRKNDILLGVDEVICGFGRLGRWFGHQHFGVTPDFVTMAKGLSSGYAPISALAVTRRVVEALRGVDGAFPHGFTYSGHPLPAAMALTNLDILHSEGLVERAARMNAYLAKALVRLEAHPIVGETRSLGLLAAIEIVADKSTNARFSPNGAATKRIWEIARNAGVWVRPLGDIIAICPPLVISEEQIDDLVSILGASFDAFLEDAEAA